MPKSLTLRRMYHSDPNARTSLRLPYARQASPEDEEERQMVANIACSFSRTWTLESGAVVKPHDWLVWGKMEAAAVAFCFPSLKSHLFTSNACRAVPLSPFCMLIPAYPRVRATSRPRHHHAQRVFSFETLWLRLSREVVYVSLTKKHTITPT